MELCLRETFPYKVNNPGHNILELYIFQEQVHVTTSRTELHIQYKNLVEELPHELPHKFSRSKKILKNLEFRRIQSLILSPSSKNYILTLAVNKYAKGYIKASRFCPILLDFFMVVQCFFQDCLIKQIFDHNLEQSPSNFDFLTLSITSKRFSNL